MSLFIVTVAAAISFLFLCVYLLRLKMVERENQLLRNYNQSIEELCASTRDKIEITRQYRHDLSKHIQALEAVIARNRANESIERYIGDLRTQYEETDQNRIRGNEIVNAITLLKKEQCAALQIPFFVNVEEYSYSRVKDADLTGILYNLLDNAVEENARISAGNPRGVWFSMSEEENDGQKNAVIEVSNCIRAGRKMNFRTVKKRPEEHGVGTIIIQKIVREYRGRREVYIDSEKSILRIRIILPLSNYSARSERRNHYGYVDAE